MTADLAAAAALAAVPEEVRARLVTRFGPGAREWCEELPRLVGGLAGRWGLAVRTAGGGGTSRVFRCERLADGAAVWLKLTPDAEVARQEAVALAAWREVPSVVGLLAEDVGAGALLLADVRPGTTLRERGWRPAEVAGMLAAMRSVPAPPPTALPSLAERLDFLFDLTERRAPGVSTADARALTRELTGGGPVGLVHGDLHPSNVLLGPAGALAIDPRACLGDPDFDLVDWALDGVADPAALSARIAALTALVAGSDADRVLAWCRASAVLVAAPRVAAGREDAGTVFLRELAGL
ncbi:aminoglycoside phosphotransferase family protein [Kitasatospora purpeofusca]|uniref:aminoglycoside phosphotransferase family protein n=1 Tax=Kitasatospora purpeofusca TaxID=67352 RepID=UPI002251C7C9|nr:aminoglycoside phosphotransferase family protein [Kitasatospora purpeofusca]MCX4759076.1 aminoglycoside phosphotransferase family protein [Kitasatospora purpeofusca]WSR30509.1 aminoglycoside phosphotransferase family protein [Kitasatospora purpeofusca]WSR38748.1 aminoglycoside phosphotransferase family protein [Kitasatospora purpeofusca]